MTRKALVPLLKKGELNNRLFVRPLADTLEKNSGDASIDLSLGRWFVVFKENSLAGIDFFDKKGTDERISKRYFVPFGDEFVIYPRSFVLATTLEWLRIPLNLVGDIVGKSSLGRRGLEIENAPVVHPGFFGCLTLELKNSGRMPAKLLPGMTIAQLRLAEVRDPLSEISEKAKNFTGTRFPTLGEIKSNALTRHKSSRKSYPT